LAHLLVFVVEGGLFVDAQEPDTEVLIAQARSGDEAARQALLARHRARLRRMVACRLDRRVATRVDPSDVVQEALAEAAHRLSDYLRTRPLPFYPWLRRLTWEHLLRLQKRHLAHKRSVLREEPQGFAPSDESVQELTGRLAAPSGTPSNRLIREELYSRVRQALMELADADREVLLMRYVEQLSVADIAAVLGISEAAVKMRHRRALDRMSRLLAGDPAEGVG
jgi:RNA polymerase sigma-70 factor (ECF subfamily)